MNTEFIIVIIISVISVVMSLSMMVISIFERKRNEMRQMYSEERIERLMMESRKYLDLNYDSSNLRKKGFSDEYEESIYLLRRLRNDISGLRSDFKNCSDANSANIDVKKVSEDIAYNIVKNLESTQNFTDISKIMLHETSSQMDVEQFEELQKANFENRIHNTYKTIQHIQHILRTPISGLKINLKTLSEEKAFQNEDFLKIYTQMENAINMIESNMRTLNSYCIDEDTQEEYNLKEQIEKYVNLLLLACDKKINLNIDNIDDKIVLSRCALDDVIFCISCIVENATSFAPDNSEIIMECSAKDSEYMMSITNFGSTISTDNAEKIFEEGFSTRESSGIGLHLAKTVVNEKLNGNLTFENLEEKNGVKFSFTFEVIQ